MPDSLADAEALSLLLPLHFFYEQRGWTLPDLVFMEAAQLPENERELLAHDHDMTSALEEYHQSRLALDVVEKEATDDYLMRLVVLKQATGARQPVEVGAIGIQLGAFPEAARKKILEGKTPLGAILSEEKVPFVSHPQAFFCLAADTFISEQLHTAPQTVLYGRCNVLSLPDGEVLADIVEILPRALDPVPDSVHRAAKRLN